jgi:hypothetical protein
MQMNQLTPEKDWVAKVNENFTKLGVGVQKTTALVGKNGWTLSSNSFAMKIPCLDGSIKILHIEATSSSTVPGLGTDIMSIPSDFCPDHTPGYMNYPVDESGHDGGYLSLYFLGSTLSSNLKAMDGHTSARGLSLNCTLMYS